MSEVKDKAWLLNRLDRLINSCSAAIGNSHKSKRYYTAKVQAYTMARKLAEYLDRRAQPDNPPLSLEQLKSMDGEPVWCEITQDNPRYGIVDVNQSEVILSHCYSLPFRWHGEWKAYAHRKDGDEG